MRGPRETPSPALDPRPCRLFVALELPPGVRDEIERAQKELRGALRDARVSWTRAEQFHLTLKFLGDVDSARVEDLTQALRGACSRFAPFRLRAEQLGCFPNPRAPRVVWVGVKDGARELSVLHGAIEATCADFTSESPDERFSGHVTLGRIKSIGRAEAEALAVLLRPTAARFFGEWTTESVALVRSELASQGARHAILAEAALGGGGD